MRKKLLYFLSCEDDTGIELATEHTDDDEVIILLIQNAVFFANKANKIIAQALSKKRKVAACKEDIEIRGLKNYISDDIQLVSYTDVIDIIFNSDKWNICYVSRH